MESEHVVPLQSPDQPTNTLLPLGVAVRVTVAALSKELWQVAPQSIPAGLELTLPVAPPRERSVTLKAAGVATVTASDPIVEPPALVAVTVYEAATATAVGVPEMTPVVALIDRPVGSAGVTAQETTAPPEIVGVAGPQAKFWVQLKEAGA
jgi:hypothetical protein